MLGSFSQSILPEVAVHLACRPVEVEWREPSDPDKLYGMCRRRGDKAVVQVDPNLDVETTLRVLLHELAHARLHFEQIRDLMALQEPGYGISQKLYDLREKQATALEEEWYEWSRKQAPIKSVSGRLLMLKYWDPGPTSAGYGLGWVDVTKQVCKTTKTPPAWVVDAVRRAFVHASKYGHRR